MGITATPPNTTPATKPAKRTTKRRSANPSAGDLVTALAQALQPRTAAKDRYVGVRNISNYVIDIPNPVRGQPSLLSLHTEFVDPSDPTRFVPNPNAAQIIPHAVWMQLRRANIYERGMIMRDDSILGDTYEAAAPDMAAELAPGWTKNAVLDPVAFIESKGEQALREAVEAMTSEESLRRLLTAVNQRVELERRRLGATGLDAKLEERALRNLPAIYHLAEELVLERLQAMIYTF